MTIKYYTLLISTPLLDETKMLYHVFVASEKKVTISLKNYVILVSLCASLSSDEGLAVSAILFTSSSSPSQSIYLAHGLPSDGVP